MLDGRETIIQHHVLYMQQTVFPGSSPGFILSHFDVPVFRSQLNHCIEDYNGDITGYQFQKQMVGLLLRTFPAFQTQHTYATTHIACIHNKRQCLYTLFRYVHLLLKTILHIFPSDRQLVHGGIFHWIGSVFQLMCSLVVYSYA